MGIFTSLPSGGAAAATSVASTVDTLSSVVLATVAALPACTAAGTGIGKTLTGNAVGLLSIDATATVNGYRVLVKNQVASADDGLFDVTEKGTAGLAFILTRCADADTVLELTAGATVSVTGGATLAGTAWQQQNALTTIDTTTQLWTEQPTGASVRVIQTAVVTDIPATLATIVGYLDTEVAAILADTVVLGTPVGADFAADIAAIKADTAAILVDTSTTLDDLVDDLELDRWRPLNGTVTGEPNAGAATRATCGGGAGSRVAYRMLHLKTLAAVAAEFTSLAWSGGPSGVIPLLTAGDTPNATFDAAGKSKNWSGWETLENGETITSTAAGSGVGTDNNFVWSIEWKPLVAGSTLT